MSLKRLLFIAESVSFSSPPIIFSLVLSTLVNFCSASSIFCLNLSGPPTESISILSYEISGDKMKISFEVYSYERMLIDAVGGPDRFKQKMEEAEEKLTRMERTKLKMIGGLEKLTDSAINSKRFRDITVKQFKDSFAGAYIEDK